MPRNPTEVEEFYIKHHAFTMDAKQIKEKIKGVSITKIQAIINNTPKPSTTEIIPGRKPNPRGVNIMTEVASQGIDNLRETGKLHSKTKDRNCITTTKK
jgi:hypothetical protein